MPLATLLEVKSVIPGNMALCGSGSGSGGGSGSGCGCGCGCNGPCAVLHFSVHYTNSDLAVNQLVGQHAKEFVAQDPNSLGSAAF